MELLRLITVITTAICFISFTGCASGSRTESKVQKDSRPAEETVNENETVEDGGDAQKDLPTDVLIDSIIAEPVFYELYSFDTFEEGMEHVNENISAMTELMGRPDAAETLLRMYSEAKVYSESEVDFGDQNAVFEANKSDFYEKLICQKDILSAMTDEQKHEFADTVYQKYQEKKAAGRSDFNHPIQPFVLTFEDEESYSSEYIYNKVAEYCAS